MSAWRDPPSRLDHPRPIADLSDRDLRRLVGPRPFLYGLRVARFASIESTAAGDHGLRGTVTTKSGVFEVELDCASGELGARCSCGFQTAQSESPCFHVAGLLIKVRDEARRRAGR